MALAETITFDDGTVWVDDREQIDVTSAEGAGEHWPWSCSCGMTSPRDVTTKENATTSAQGHADTHHPIARVLVEIDLDAAAILRDRSTAR